MRQESVPPQDIFGRRLTIGVDRRGDEVEIALEGELDIGSAVELEEALLAAEASGAKVIRVDLRRLEFLDSTGLRVILSAELRASVDGLRLVLVPGPERVQRLFALTGTLEYLHFADDGSPPENVSDLHAPDKA